MTGYYCLREDGSMAAFGDAALHGSAVDLLEGPAVALAVDPYGDGYWIASRRGQVVACGVPDLVGTEGVPTNGEVVDVVATGRRGGLWVLDRAGGVFCFGAAGFHGSVPGLELDAPIEAVSLTPAPDDDGYWILDRAGGVFCFGEARYFGSIPEMGGGTAAAVTLLAATDEGYSIVTEDGTCHAFGRAPETTSAGALRPIVAATCTPDGVLLVDSEGIVYPLGMAPFLGAPVASGSSSPIVDVAWTEKTD